MIQTLICMKVMRQDKKGSLVDNSLNDLKSKKKRIISSMNTAACVLIYSI